MPQNSPGNTATRPPIIAWRTALDMAITATADDPTSRFLSLATIGLSGYPSNRTVVFRGFQTDSNELLFATDARSHKITELLKNPRAEVCWYFLAQRLQFRIRGDLQIIDGSNRAMGQVRLDLWRELSDAARHQFAWPTPGAERTAMLPKIANLSVSPQLPLPPFFVLALEPNHVDVLNINFEPHRRVIHERVDGAWKSTHVNP